MTRTRDVLAIVIPVLFIGAATYAATGLPSTEFHIFMLGELAGIVAIALMIVLSGASA